MICVDGPNNPTPHPDARCLVLIGDVCSHCCSFALLLPLTSNLLVGGLPPPDARWRCGVVFTFTLTGFTFPACAPVPQPHIVACALNCHRHCSLVTGLFTVCLRCDTLVYGPGCFAHHTCNIVTLPPLLYCSSSPVITGRPVIAFPQLLLRSAHCHFPYPTVAFNWVALRIF